MDGTARQPNYLDGWYGTTRQPNYWDGTTRQPNYLDGTTRQPNYLDGTTRHPYYLDGTTRQPNFLDGTTRQPNYLDRTTRQPNYSDGTTKQPTVTTLTGPTGSLTTRTDENTVVFKTFRRHRLFLKRENIENFLKIFAVKKTTFFEHRKTRHIGWNSIFDPLPDMESDMMALSSCICIPENPSLLWCEEVGRGRCRKPTYNPSIIIKI